MLVPHLTGASKILAQAEVLYTNYGQVGIEDKRPKPLMPLDLESVKAIAQKSDLDPKNA